MMTTEELILFAVIFGTYGLEHVVAFAFAACGGAIVCYFIYLGIADWIDHLRSRKGKQ